MALSKLATLFAVTFGICFGLCAVGLITMHDAATSFFIPTILVIEALCVLGLLTVAVVAIVRRARTGK